MMHSLTLVKPKCLPPLDENFRPAALANHAFQAAVRAAGGGVPLVFGLERSAGSVSRFAISVLPDDHPDSHRNLAYAERLLKFLLWQRGGWRVYVGGPGRIGGYLAQMYGPTGARVFDYHFMGEQVYDKPFSVVACAPEEVPAEQESERPLGRHLTGCRIGFDLGASDIKVSAVIDGNAVFSREIVWEPRKQSDPAYHYQHIKAALDMAAAHLPQVDAIGGSAAGVYIDNRVRVASLFRGVPPERFGEARDFFLRLRDETGVPLVVVNDGEVTALAGSMSLEDNGVLGIALGSSEAGGFVTGAGNITNWLNELAFAPIDYSPTAPCDEWSGDAGVGALYLSQQCVFRLAPVAGITILGHMPDAEKLKLVQDQLEAGHAGARHIWQTMGIYLGYAIAHYASFYDDLKHVLILGRCTSGQGGALLLDGAREVLDTEFPELARSVHLQLPDERSRRVGQSIAAASLPKVD